MKKLVYALSFCFMTIFIVGCSSITLPGEDGEETTIDFKDIEDGNLDISVEDSNGEKQSINFEADEDGSASFSQSDGEKEFVSQTGSDISLPEDFPSDFPFPEGTTYTSMQTLTEDGKKAHSVQFIFEQEPEEVFNMYKEFAESKGYQIAQEMKMEGMYSLVATNEENGEGFNITISHDESEQMGNVTIGAASE